MYAKLVLTKLKITKSIYLFNLNNLNWRRKNVNSKIYC